MSTHTPSGYQPRVPRLGRPERDDPSIVRRRGKELRERGLATLLLLPAAPVMAGIATAITIEGWLDPAARGPVFFVEQRISRGRIIDLVKFRTINAAALAQLDGGPSHIKRFERAGMVTWVGRWLTNWYLDELPQILNIVAGDMFVIGTRPYPLDAYEAELSAGRTRKRDMPGGLVGPVQSYKGASSPSEYDLDLEYWEAFTTWSARSLLALDGQILRRSVKVQMAHEGR